MVKDSGELKDGTDEECSNRDEESDVQVKGEKTKATVGTFGGQN